MTPPKILVLKRADLNYDIRTLRHGVTLSKIGDVTFGISTANNAIWLEQHEVKDFFTRPLPLPGRVIRRAVREMQKMKPQDFATRLKRDSWSNQMISTLSQRRFDLVVANDVDSLPAALEIANGAPVLCDLHEHAPTELANLPGWTDTVGAYKSWLCREYLNKATSLITVSKSLAVLYADEFHTQVPHVVRNAVKFHRDVQHQRHLPPKKLIHAGIAAPIRKLEVHASIASALGDDYTVSMLLKPVETIYYQQLQFLSKVLSNFEILPPVSPDSMVDALSHYDAGIYVLDAVTQQLKVTLPNKFFEFVQARLPIYSGGLPEVDELIGAYEIGVGALSSDPEVAAKQIKESASLDWGKIQANLEIAAHELSYEEESKKLLELAESLLSLK